jgi:hypothetical protein
MCGVWFVKVVGGVSGWCMVCIGNGMKNGFVVTHERANGWSQLWSLMRHDELRDMGHFCAKKKKSLLGTQLQICPI